MAPETLAPFAEPRVGHSVWQLVATGTSYILLWGAAAWLAPAHPVFALLVTIPAAGFLMRLFMLLHDCSHGSFFRSRRANEAIGFGIGLLTLTPYAWWRRTHAIHHATNGNLDRRGIGDIKTMTVAEYLRHPWWRRLKYRLYRNPVILFGIGPAWVFGVLQRFPSIAPRSWTRERAAIRATNFGLAAMVVAASLTIGWKTLLLVQIPITILACSAGLWLFYVQHQFETTYWERDTGWDPTLASMHGSSHYRLPAVFRWLTCNIGIHHLHHLNPKIPNYRLQECLKDNPALGVVPEVTFWQSLRCLSLKLWDEECGRLVRYRDLRALRRLA